MSKCDALKIPVIFDENFVKAIEIAELADETSYQTKDQTNSDCIISGILNIVNILCRFMVKSAKANILGAERILRCVHATSKLKIVYREEEVSVMLVK